MSKCNCLFLPLFPLQILRFFRSLFGTRHNNWSDQSVSICCVVSVDHKHEQNRKKGKKKKSNTIKNTNKQNAHRRENTTCLRRENASLADNDLLKRRNKNCVDIYIFFQVFAFSNETTSKTVRSVTHVRARIHCSLSPLLSLLSIARSLARSLARVHQTTVTACARSCKL